MGETVELGDVFPAVESGVGVVFEESGDDNKPLGVGQLSYRTANDVRWTTGEKVFQAGGGEDNARLSAPEALPLRELCRRPGPTGLGSYCSPTAGFTPFPPK